MGKNKDGRVEPVQVSRMGENQGLGFKNKGDDIKENWWQNTFSNALNGVKANLSKRILNYEAEGSDTTEDEESDDHSEEESSEYNEEDELEFQRISRKYLKKE